MTESIDAAKVYQKRLPEAQALATEDILPYRLVADLALVNVTTAMAFFTTVEGQIATQLPHEDLAALQSLAEVAVAVKFAAMQAEKDSPSETEVAQKTTVGWMLRGVLLAGAKGLAAAGLLPAHQVHAIASGRGARDMAEDCVDLTELYRANLTTIAGKHAVTADQIVQAAEVGTFLLQHLRPKNAPTEKAPAPSPMVDTRNRLATLLVKRYERLQAVAHYFVGNSWQDKVPPLMSRTLKRSVAEKNG